MIQLTESDQSNRSKINNFPIWFQKIRQSTQPGKSDCTNGLNLLKCDPMINLEGGTTSQMNI